MMLFFRIYIESCRRLKKIKNSPILLAKRKAAGRKFREGQKLKKMVNTDHSFEENTKLNKLLLTFKAFLAKHFE